MKSDADSSIRGTTRKIQSDSQKQIIKTLVMETEDVSLDHLVLVCTDLQDVLAVPDALLGPEGDDSLGAAAS